MRKLKGILNNYFLKVLRQLDKWVNEFWYKNPLASSPISSAEYYLYLASEISNISYPEIDQYELNNKAAIDPDWLNRLALHTQIVIKKSPLCYAHGRVLYSALSLWLSSHPKQYPNDAVVIYETGTARGFSALCMAKAMADQQRPGRIITFDVLPHTTPMYWNCIDDLDRPKTRAELLEPWNELVQNYIVFQQGDTRISLPKVRSSRINFAFLDGAHTYQDVMFEFMQIAPFQKMGDVIVYDDYNTNQFPGLVKAVDEICANKGYARFDLSAHNGRSYVVATKL